MLCMLQLCDSVEAADYVHLALGNLLLLVVTV